MHIGPVILSAILAAVGILTRRYECRSFVGKEDETRNEIYRKPENIPSGISVVSNNGSSSAYIRFSERSIGYGDRDGVGGDEPVENVVIGKGGDLAPRFRQSANIDHSDRPRRRLKRETLSPLKVGLVAFIVLLCLLILIVGLYICYLLVQGTDSVQGTEVQVAAEAVQEVPFYSQDEESQEPDRQERRKKERAGGERSDRKEQEEERASSLQEQLTTLLDPKDSGQQN